MAYRRRCYGTVGGENEALLDATIDFDAIKATPNRLGVKVKFHAQL